MSAEDVEQARRQVDRLCWAGIGLGLAFTMTNVQQFAANGAPVWSPAWLGAWLLDPMVSLVLLAVLRAEQTTARCRVGMGGWVRVAKWFTLAATYVMNTWAAYVSGSAAQVVLHSVPPLVVFVAAEAVTVLRDNLTEAASREDAASTASVNGEPLVNGGRSRRTFADYLAEAEAAWSPEVEVTPAWIREVTGCSRGLSSRLARELRERVNAVGKGVRP